MVFIVNNCHRGYYKDHEPLKGSARDALSTSQPMTLSKLAFVVLKSSRNDTCHGSRDIPFRLATANALLALLYCALPVARPCLEIESCWTVDGGDSEVPSSCALPCF
jgi:hypothetical protein